MFPPTHDPDRPATRSLRTAIRDAADLAIAFLTLESYGLDDVRPARSMRATHGHHGAQPDDAAADPGTPRASRAAVGAELLLTTPQPPASPASAAHAHRRGLRAPERGRRPGTVRPRAQHCLTPVGSASAIGRPDRTAAPSQRPRTAPQDTPH